MVSIAMRSCSPAISSLNSTVMVLSSVTASLGVTATTSNGAAGASTVNVISPSITTASPLLARVMPTLAGTLSAYSPGVVIGVHNVMVRTLPSTVKLQAFVLDPT